MSITKLQYKGIHHVSLNVSEIEQAKTFYKDILGLVEIKRPPFEFPGAWFAVGENGQQLHLIVHNGETTRTGDIDTMDGHFALRVSDFEATLAWLEQHHIEHRTNRVSVTGFAQIFILDPDRNVIELNVARSHEYDQHNF